MTFFSILLLKLIRKALKLSGRGRGTALPGLIGEKYFYKSLSKLPKQLDQIIIITGTNGKTTTSKIVRSILKQNKIKVLSNISGANLTRGIISALVFDTNLFGKLKSKVGVFEVEEASMEKTVRLLNPDIALITNLFRDQMDAYGELDHTREVIENGLKEMKKDSITLLNANDPKVSYMAKIVKGQVKYYGINDLNIPTDEENAVPDSLKSPDDRSVLEYSKIYFSHIGLYKSKDGKFSTPKLDFKVSDYKVENDKDNLPKVSFTLKNEEIHSEDSENTIQVEDFKLPGLYNVINCLAAYSIVEQITQILIETNYTKGKAISVENTTQIQHDYSKISAAFGRGEKIKLKLGDNNYVTLLLVKNPTGFNSALGAINDIENKNIVFALNDNTADGKDVSWIWDCNFEAVRKYNRVVVTGERGADLALRCKYAEIPCNLVDNYHEVILEFIQYQTEDRLIKFRKDINIYALCSYTALLAFRKDLAKIADVKHFEEEI
jgi:UDP-N-acetylmuramyl tripeptide synthase